MVSAKETLASAVPSLSEGESQLESPPPPLPPEEEAAAATPPLVMLLDFWSLVVMLELGTDGLIGFEREM